MNTQAKLKVKTLFENRFNKEKFVSFIADLLNEVENDTSFPPLRGRYIKAPFQNGIHEYERVCKYIDSLGNQIDVLIVKLKDKSKLENARTFQRNFVVDYLNGGRGGKLKDGALVAFYSDDISDWRFSFVKLEYELKEENGKIKENKKMNSAKRYSFLVGENENSHTAQSQLLPLLEDDINNPTLKQIEDVFGVEIVTKEFFEKYKELFLQVNNHLEEIVRKDTNVKNDFESKEISIGDFAKKLLGQIVFLYFLQKKGWFGVPMTKKWGEGDRRFLRSIFEKSNKESKNFFNDYLEPLFYEALAKERDGNYYSRFECKIPFLNGGLFDPIGDYDWWNTVINLPNDLFSNNYISQDKHKDIGTGILDVFDRYNFTVREDEPLEKEVAIDPEMLGKVFENMLEVKDRKSKGTYYTPREIVHYMCQESLINYLESNLSTVSRDDLVYLVKKAEYDKEKEQAGVEGIKVYEINSKFPEDIKIYSNEIDQLLADIKVCDPAIGSGAFPVGMMNEIVKVRSILTEFLPNNSNRSEYEFKRHAIANSIHGVDIDQGAVEIAKLRLWLSLIVDEDDISNIKPLPNLDYKIMQGNSLIEEFEGIKLFDDSLLNNDDSYKHEIMKLKDRQHVLQKEYFEIYHDNTKKSETDQINKELELIKKKLIDLNKPQKVNDGEIDLFKTRDEAKEKADQLQVLQKKFFEASQKSEKERIKQQIDDLIWDLIETTVRHEGSSDKLAHIQKIRRSNNKPFFLWKLNFADVFKEKGGFDVVIANPPYVKEYTQKDAFDGLRKSPYYKGKMDLWYFFACFGIDILHEGGILTLIAQNNWVTSYGASKMRDKIITETQILTLIDFGNYMIFDTADIQTMVMIFSKVKPLGNYHFNLRRIVGKPHSPSIINDLLEEKKAENIEILHPNIKPDSLINKSFSFNNVQSNKLLNKLTKDSIFLNGDKEIAQGIVPNPDVVNSRNIKKIPESMVRSLEIQVGDGVFVVDENKFSDLTLKEKLILKPLYEPFQFEKYFIPKKTSKKLIYFIKGLNPADYPTLIEHLSKYKEIMLDRRENINGRLEYYHLHWPRDEKFFKEGKKILCVRKSSYPLFIYTENPAYVMMSVNIIKSDRINLKYLTAILNSRIVAFWLQKRGKLQGSNFQLDKEPLTEIPIRLASVDSVKSIVDIVDQILAITEKSDYLNNEIEKSQIKSLQTKIDQMIYKLYELSDEEIKIVKEETQHLY